MILNEVGCWLTTHTDTVSFHAIAECDDTDDWTESIDAVASESMSELESAYVVIKFKSHCWNAVGMTYPQLFRLALNFS